MFLCILLIYYRNKLKFKGIYLSKALTCMKIFVKETDTFDHIVVLNTYTSHKDHLTPQHTAFEQLTACLSVFLELLPGLIWLKIIQTNCRYSNGY